MICMTANPLPVSHEALTAAAQDTSLPDQVLTQWFGSPRPGNADALKHKAQWFTKSAAFDEELRQRFGTAVEAALGGALQHWATQGPWQQLALVILLDQFTRNIHRNTPKSFAGDAQALALALQAMDSGTDQQLPEVARVFMYLPLEHAEDPAMQQRSVAAFEALLQSAKDAELREREDAQEALEEDFADLQEKYTQVCTLRDKLYEMQVPASSCLRMVGSEVRCMLWN